MFVFVFVYEMNEDLEKVNGKIIKTVLVK